MKYIYYVNKGKDDLMAVLKGTVVYENDEYIAFVMDGSKEIRTHNKKYNAIHDLTTAEGKAKLYESIHSYYGSFFNMNPYDFSEEELKLSVDSIRMETIKETLKRHERYIDDAKRSIVRYEMEDNNLKTELLALEAAHAIPTN